MFPDSVPLAFLAAFALLIVCLCSYVLVFADADVSLLFLEKFGKPVGALRGKVAWVTGAASGIGKQLSLQLARNGTKLILSDLSSEGLEKVRTECLAASSLNQDDILVLPFNLTRTEVHRDCMDRVIQKFGQLDVVFHNAGCSQRANYKDISGQVDKDMFDVNCFGHVSLSRIVLDHYLQKGSGQFVVTSSALGKFGFPRASTYVATKHALIGYFTSLYLEYCSNGISVTIICPGPVFSGLYDNSFTEKAGQFYSGGMQASDRRMTAQRCAQLMLLATANKVEEAWPCIQPGLIWLYMNQYAPTISKRIATRLVSTEIADVLRDGRKKKT